jgi:hypothetical protein
MLTPEEICPMLTPSDVGIRVQRTSITGARVWLATNGNRIAHRGSTSPQQAFLSRGDQDA